MNHKLPMITVSIYGTCTDCKKHIHIEKHVTDKELEMFNVMPHAAFDFEDLFNKVKNHVCRAHPQHEVETESV